MRACLADRWEILNLSEPTGACVRLMGIRLHSILKQDVAEYRRWPIQKSSSIVFTTVFGSNMIKGSMRLGIIFCMQEPSLLMRTPTNMAISLKPGFTISAELECI